MKFYSKLLFYVILMITMFSSCYTTRTVVGDGPVGRQGSTDVYSKSKQAYLFWGLMPLGFSSPKTPSDNNCQVKTSMNVIDAIVSGLTGGIVTMQTIKILVHHEKK